MIDLVDQWKRASNNKMKQALSALRFVQDEVRYFGFEEGMGSFKPTDPCLVLQRRFGDCKDKTFLLHALLHLMDIPSTPVLVHSKIGRRLPEALPSPFGFNHVVLKIDISNSTYWVDPTISSQGGSLKHLYFPDYRWGILLEENTTHLTRLPKVGNKIPTEIKTSITFTQPESADVTIQVDYYNEQADYMRRRLNHLGSKALADNFLKMFKTIMEMQRSVILLKYPMIVKRTFYP
jgi:hypothetical protein